MRVRAPIGRPAAVSEPIPVLRARESAAQIRQIVGRQPGDHHELLPHPEPPPEIPEGGGEDTFETFDLIIAKMNEIADIYN